MQPTATETPPRVRLFERATLEAREYWTRRLDREVEPAVPPADFAPGTGDRGVDAVEREVAGEAFATLARLTRGNAFLVHAALCAALQVCLQRYRGGSGPVAVGTPPRVGTGEAPAPNLLPVVETVDGAASFREVLGAARQALLDAYAHQGYPFNRMMDDLRVADAGRRAAYHAVVLATEGVSGALPDDVEPELAIHARPLDDRVRVRIAFRRGRHRRATVEAFAEHLLALLAALLGDPAAPAGQAPMMDEAAREREARGLNHTARLLPAASVHALFAAQAARTPHAPAVAHGGESVTYAELDARAARLAAWLRARGVRGEARVGVHLERGTAMVAAFLAILRAGGAYLPLDPAAPPERIREILDDAGASLVLTQRDRAGALPDGVASFALDDPSLAAELDTVPVDCPPAEAGPDALAYVVYTSGSTGRPKGVAVPHRGVVRLVRETDYVPFGPGDRIAQLSSAAFDAATFEIWGALLNGGCVAVIDRDVSLFPPALGAALRQGGVTHLFLTTALFNRVAREAPDAFGTLRHLLFGGEAADPGAVARVRGGPGRLLHVYGPTESTTYAAWHAVDDVDPAAATVPIGLPLANTTLYVLDGGMSLVPAGVPGELYVGGAGLARGYLGRPALTAERFVPHPFGGAGERLYRTGDRVRRGHDGALEFLGRYDFQVKIRGFRVEPGEVEAALLRRPGVREAIVVVRDDEGEKRLVGYVVADEGLDVESLRAHLAERLPSYMVPSALAPLAALPLNDSGKVDRAALPAPGPEGAAGDVAPRTPTEEIVAGIWADLLRLPRVGVEDDFFVLGGHSLMATQVVARVRDAFGVEVPLRALFDAPTATALAAHVDAALAGGQAAPVAPVARVPRDAPLPLSFSQARLWFLDRMEPGSSAYHMPYAMRLRGALDTGALEAAFAALVARHESLRTRFTDVGGQPVQVIDPPSAFLLPVVAVEGADEPAREAEALRLTVLEAARPFDLARGPLFRASLLRLGPRDHVLLATAHHIVSDGWSMDVVVREVSALYDGIRRGAPPALPDLPVQYADYAVWQRERLVGDALDRQLAWWKERLDGAPPLLEIPTDHPRAAQGGARAGAHDFALSEEATRALRALGRREGATLFMVLLAGWQALLARHAGTHDVVVGTPVSGRTRVELEGLVGFFVNTLALRIDLAGDPAFTALLARVRDVTLGAWQHQDLPFDRLVEELGVERSLAHTPVFQAMFSLERAGRGGSLDLGDAAAEWFGGWGEGARFDLELTMMERETRIAGVLRYRAALFDPATAERMAARFTALLEAAAADASRPLSRLGAMDPAERARVLAAASVPAAPYPEATVHDLFSAQAAATPEATAILFGGARTTYAAVEARANRLAHHLRRRGVAADGRVALCLERGPDLYVAMLGILKAGAAFVPLDPSYPPERLAAMVADAGARVLVTTTRLSAELPVAFPEVVRMDGGRALDGEPDTPPSPAGDPDSLAYVVFTSGSTGTPKGVAVPHRAVVRLVRETTYAELGPGETLLQLAPVSFDASTFEIWGALLNGGTLAVFPPGVPSLDEIARFVRERGVTTLWLTAGLFHPLVDADPQAFRGVRQLVAGGDVLSPGHVRRVLEACPGLVVVNGYGPTENTTFTACARIAAPAEVENGVPIGHPVAHTTAYVVDAGMRLVPDGVPGELVTGGAGLARGYVGHPAMTAERFVPSPFGPAGARLYRTGDRVRRRPDGRLEFLGRADAQVKIRGFRVEPGEVEAALRAHPGVHEAVVAVHEDAAGDRRLVAYTVAEPGAAPTAADLRAALAGRLPEYMLPAAFVALDALPVNANGKVDRRALPAPSWNGEEAYVAPRTSVEEVLAGIWEQVLGWGDRGDGERVGVHDDFFVLGGHSLLATQVVARVQRAFGVEFPVRTVFEAPTVAAFAERVEAALLGGLSDADLAAVEGMTEQELARYLDALENEG